MPEVAGAPVHCIIDDRSETGTTTDAVDIPSSDWLRGMSLARWTEGKVFESGFPVGVISTGVRVGSSDSRNDIAIVDHSSDYPVPVWLTARDDISLTRPISGVRVYTVAIVVRNASGRNYATLWTGINGTNDDALLAGYPGHIVLAEVTVPAGSGNRTVDSTMAPVSVPRTGFS